MRILFLFLYAFSGAVLSAQTLEDYFRIALENNAGLLGQHAEYEAALQKIPQARALPDPQINASVFINPMMLPMGNQRGSISAMQMFPWFGVRAAMANEAARMADVKQQLTRVKANELRYQLKTVWYPLLELELQIHIRQENIRLLETDKQLATAKFQNGLAPMTDALRADLMIDEVRTEIALLEQKRTPLTASFNALLSRPAGTPIPVQPEFQDTAFNPADIRGITIENNPALAVFDQQKQAAQASEKVAESMKKPMIGLGLQYMPLAKRPPDMLHLLPNTGGDMLMPMVSVTVPIWQKKYRAAAYENRLMQSAYEQMKADTRNSLNAMAEMARYELTEKTQRIQLLNSQQVKTQQIIDLLLAAYGNSGQGFEEILRLQQQLFNYRLEIVSMQTEYRLALSNLEFLTGK